MKRYTCIFVCCLMLLAAVTAHAQVGFTGPQGFTGQVGFTGQYGFTGQAVTVAQTQTFYDKTPIIVRGNIVQAIDRKSVV
jgi:uncharacterized protein YdeI (BOF family)